jgi:hypothetical protein
LPLPDPLTEAATDLDRERWRRAALEQRYITLRARDDINVGRLTACADGLAAQNDE